MAVEAFANNWAYLKVELNSLERLILTAVARQKKDQKEADRLLRTPADRAAQHWFQGIITNLEGPIGYDSPPPARSAKPQTYNQQLETRLQATQAAGKRLALPMLIDRLQLTVYEKNLILLGIAPEIHRRYAKLYEYLNGSSSHLLTVDLSLRLLCRNDQEWRAARSRLKPTAPLLHYQLIEILAHDDRAFLQHSIRLSGDLVNYLLADQTLPEDLDRLLGAADVMAPLLAPLLAATPIAPETSPESDLPAALAAAGSPPLWTEVPNSLQSFADGRFAGHLVLPETVRSPLQRLAQELKFGPQIDEDWGFGAWQGGPTAGKMVLMVGPAGTGKTAAASAIAQFAQLPLVQIDLAQIDLALDLETLCQQLQIHPVPILLVRNADRWLSRTAAVNPTAIAQFCQLRAQAGNLTVFSIRYPIALPQVWRQRLTQTLIFAKPNAPDRQQIWQSAFPPQVTFDPAIDWADMARHALTGGEIMQVARSAALLALAAAGDGSELRVTIGVIQAAIADWRSRRG
jgi:ATPase family associated with various cellular activities (AAA)